MEKESEHFKDIIDRASWFKVSQCSQCGRFLIYLGPWENKEAEMRKHFFETGHSSFEALALDIVCQDTLDHDWFEDYGERQREAFERLKQSEEWKQFRLKLKELEDDNQNY